jgi:ketosteroid isomerase-like protein
MSENLQIVRSLHTHWERGEFFEHAEWAHPEIECVMVDGPTPGSGTGLAGMARVWRDVISAYEQFSVTAEEYREVDARRVLVLVRFSGRGKTSGMDLGSVSARNASVLEIEDGLVRRLALYWDRERAFADLGLAE